LNLLATVLPWLEIFCGILLIFGIAWRGTALLILIMLTGFTFVIIRRAIGIHDGGIPWLDIKFDCGCGGGEVYIYKKLPENIGLWLLSLIILLSRSRRFCLDLNLLSFSRNKQLR